MVKIIHRLDPAGITPPVFYDVKQDTNVLDWLNKTFDSQYDLCGDLACSFKLNEKEIFRSDHDNVDQSRLDFTLGYNDQLKIINRPGDTGDIMTGLAISFGALGIAALIHSLKPKLPGAQEAAHESPNNRLNAASNEFRPGQGIPECFGDGVSFPDFIQPSSYRYIKNKKIVTGLFCASEGELELPITRAGDTDINDIPESSAQVF